MYSPESQFHGLSCKKIAELKRKAEKNKAYYEKNRKNLIEKTKERQRQSRQSSSRSQMRGLIKESQKQIKAKEIREKKCAAEQERRTKIRERVRRHRAKSKSQKRAIPSKQMNHRDFQTEHRRNAEQIKCDTCFRAHQERKHKF